MPDPTPQQPDQIRRLVDKQVIGKEVREPAGVYLVHQLGQAADPATWSAEKTRKCIDAVLQGLTWPRSLAPMVNAEREWTFSAQ